MKTTEKQLLISYSDTGFRGTLSYGDYTNNLLDESVTELIEKAKNVLNQDLNLIDAEITLKYDVSALFNEFDFINVSKFAGYIDINPNLMRHYASGAKHPSEKQFSKILNAFYVVANRMREVSLAISDGVV
jgi:hypothetical protein